MAIHSYSRNRGVRKLNCCCSAFIASWKHTEGADRQNSSFLRDLLVSGHITELTKSLRGHPSRSVCTSSSIAESSGTYSRSQAWIWPLAAASQCKGILNCSGNGYLLSFNKRKTPARPARRVFGASLFVCPPQRAGFNQNDVQFLH